MPDPSPTERRPTTEAETDALADARHRDAELSSGVVTARSHEEIMAAARRAIGCD